MSAILQPHRERTIQRMKAQKSVLCIQDGSDLNYSTLEGCEGLGFVGTNQSGKQSKGLHLHSTFAALLQAAEFTIPAGYYFDANGDSLNLPNEDMNNAGSVTVHNGTVSVSFGNIRPMANAGRACPLRWEIP